MKIAQVAPLWERVPPANYGGIELVVSHLTNKLVLRGHKVKSFTSGDSQTLADLEAVYPRSLPLDKNIQEYVVYEAFKPSQFYQNVVGFDNIHSRVGSNELSWANLVTAPTVFTEDKHKFSPYYKQPYVSISNAQRQVHLNYIRTVDNGIDQPKQPPYVAFLESFASEKDVKMAEQVDAVDAKFFEKEIVTHIDGGQLQYLDEINHTQKAELSGSTAITLFSINKQQACGLEMVESMVAGTSVIQMNLGSVPFQR